MSIEKINSIINKCSQDTVDLKVNLSGFSGARLVSALQQLTKCCEDSVYLEVGVFQGLTLTSVASFNPDIKCFGIDNFKVLDPDNKNSSIVEQRLDEFTSGNAEIINMDFEEALLNLNKYINNKKVGVYFIDGPHDYRSQYLCLEFVKPYLSDNAIILVDDSNYSHVRRANYDWLRANPEYTLIFEEYTDIHPQNMSKHEKINAKDGWWDGINIIYRDKEKKLSRKLPKITNDVELFYDDHVIHSTKYAKYARKILSAFSHGIFAAIGYTLYFFLTPKPKQNKYKAVNVNLDE